MSDDEAEDFLSKLLSDKKKQRQKLQEESKSSSTDVPAFLQHDNDKEKKVNPHDKTTSFLDNLFGAKKNEQSSNFSAGSFSDEEKKHASTVKVQVPSPGIPAAPSRKTEIVEPKPRPRAGKRLEKQESAGTLLINEQKSYETKSPNKVTGSLGRDMKKKVAASKKATGTSDTEPKIRMTKTAMLRAKSASASNISGAHIGKLESSLKESQSHQRLNLQEGRHRPVTAGSGRMRSTTITNHQTWTRPGSSKLKSPSIPDLSKLQFNNANELRQAVFEVWLLKKHRNVEEQKCEQFKKLKDCEMEKSRDKQKRLQDSEIAIIAWEDHKKKELKEKLHSDKAELEKKEQAKAEKERKKSEAEIAFKLWCKKKNPEVEKWKTERRVKEDQDKRKKESEKFERLKEAEVSYEHWKQSKDNKLKTRQLEAEKLKEKKEMQEKREKRDKRKDARKAYQEWVEKKLQEEKLWRTERRQRLFEDTLRLHSLPPWSPPGSKVFM